MKNSLIKIGAYLLLATGSIIALGLIFTALATIVLFPEANLTKKLFVAAGMVIVGGIIFMISLGLFEFMMEIIKIEQEVAVLEKENGLK